MGVAFFLGWIFGLRKSQRQVSLASRFRGSHVFLYRNFAMAASMFMNSNSLPIALMQSLVVTVPGLKWGWDDNKNAMIGRALTYLVMHSTLGMMVRYIVQCLVISS
jgi:predicted permease